MGSRGGINTYGYVGGNPLTYMDSFGLSKSGWKSSNMDPERQGCKNLLSPRDNACKEYRRQVENTGSRVRLAIVQESRVRSGNHSYADGIQLAAHSRPISATAFPQIALTGR
ncbi:hypothetical protein LP420_16435 [Massilia sp. B-10]|nr:hypothetical protein LP420_16435 [Massilia sp. B-10]